LQVFQFIRRTKGWHETFSHSLFHLFSNLIGSQKVRSWTFSSRKPKSAIFGFLANQRLTRHPVNFRAVHRHDDDSCKVIKFYGPNKYVESYRAMCGISNAIFGKIIRITMLIIQAIKKKIMLLKMVESSISGLMALTT